MKKNEQTFKTTSPTMSKNLEDMEDKSLRDQQELRAIMDASPIGISWSDMQGNIKYTNHVFQELFGYSLEDIPTIDTWFLRAYPSADYRKHVVSLGSFFIDAKVQGKEVEPLEVTITCKDGNIRHVLQTLVITPNRFLAIFYDITERKKIEKALKKSEEQYRLLADNMTENVWLMDLNSMRTIYLSPSAEKMHGYTTDEYKKISLKKILTPESFQKMTDAFVTEMPKALATPPPAIHKFSLEVQARHRDGHLMWIENTISFLRDENGNITLMLGESRDITQRKQAEELLKKSEEQYRLLADHVKDQVWLMDMNFNVKYSSPSVEKMLGYTTSELKQLTTDKLITPESIKKAVNTLSEAKAAPRDDSAKRELELEFICKDGRTIWAECTFSFIKDEKGKPVSILGEGKDITERRKAEEKLQHTLERLKRAVGTTIQVLVSALEAKDPYTAGHQSQTANLACAIAEEMGLDKDIIEGVRMAGIIHDIGKLAVPAEILTKPTKLTKIEFSLIKEHSQRGYEMLKDVESPWPLAQIVHQHHERINGSGYPKNLKGDEILLEARIMAVADVVEAMASHRPYRASLGIKAALEEIEKNKGLLYDDNVADACLRLFHEKGYHLD